ncbi:hypothetical protein C0995_003852 [Termitomyces sp. Mi166|nr:hypothetical protein C0995_003852 [Termitomyces sp. Mi166\
MFRSHGEGFRKVKADRKMYAEFVQWAEGKGKGKTGGAGAGEEKPRQGNFKRKRTEEELRELQDMALVHFNKKDAFEALARERERRASLKQGVKMIMDKVRERLGGEEGVTEFFGREGENGVRRVVLEEKERLSIVSVSVVRDEGSVDATEVG